MPHCQNKSVKEKRICHCYLYKKMAFLVGKGGSGRDRSRIVFYWGA